MLVKISLRDVSKQEALSQIRGLNSEYRKLMTELFSELQSGLIYKELPKNFFTGMPADIRNKYEEVMSGNRKQIRELYQVFPEFWAQYQEKNKPYFRKEKRDKDKAIDDQESANRQPGWNLKGLTRKELESMPI
jgi:hypothetical protein